MEWPEDEGWGGVTESQVVEHCVMPCNLTCKKCGSDSIHRQHRAKKAEWRVYGEQEYKNKYAKVKLGYRVASKEHIEHHCRECHFEWQTLPREQEA